jgi:hypothetical protein
MSADSKKAGIFYLTLVTVSFVCIVYYSFKAFQDDVSESRLAVKTREIKNEPPVSTDESGSAAGSKLRKALIKNQKSAIEILPGKISNPADILSLNVAAEKGAHPIIPGPPLLTDQEIEASIRRAQENAAAAKDTYEKKKADAMFVRGQMDLTAFASPEAAAAKKNQSPSAEPPQRQPPSPEMVEKIKSGKYHYR